MELSKEQAADVKEYLNKYHKYVNELDIVGLVDNEDLYNDYIINGLIDMKPTRVSDYVKEYIRQNSYLLNKDVNKFIEGCDIFHKKELEYILKHSGVM